MIVTLQTERIRTIGQVAAFVEANEPVEFQPADRAGAYDFVSRTLARLGHRARGRQRPDALRQAALPARRGGLPETRRLVRGARRRSQRHERPAGRPRPQRQPHIPNQCAWRQVSTTDPRRLKESPRTGSLSHWNMLSIPQNLFPKITPRKRRYLLATAFAGTIRDRR